MTSTTHWAPAVYCVHINTVAQNYYYCNLILRYFSCFHNSRYEFLSSRKFLSRTLPGVHIFQIHNTCHIYAKSWRIVITKQHRELMCLSFVLWIRLRWIGLNVFFCVRTRASLVEWNFSSFFSHVHISCCLCCSCRFRTGVCHIDIYSFTLEFTTKWVARAKIDIFPIFRYLNICTIL